MKRGLDLRKLNQIRVNGVWFDADLFEDHGYGKVADPSTSNKAVLVEINCYRLEVAIKQARAKCKNNCEFGRIKGEILQETMRLMTDLIHHVDERYLWSRNIQDVFQVLDGHYDQFVVNYIYTRYVNPAFDPG